MEEQTHVVNGSPSLLPAWSIMSWLSGWSCWWQKWWCHLSHEFTFVFITWSKWCYVQIFECWCTFVNWQWRMQLSIITVEKKISVCRSKYVPNDVIIVTSNWLQNILLAFYCSLVTAMSPYCPLTSDGKLEIDNSNCMPINHNRFLFWMSHSHFWLIISCL